MKKKNIATIKILSNSLNIIPVVLLGIMNLDATLPTKSTKIVKMPSICRESIKVTAVVCPDFVSANCWLNTTARSAPPSKPILALNKSSLSLRRKQASSASMTEANRPRVTFKNTSGAFLLRSITVVILE